MTRFRDWFRRLVFVGRRSRRGAPPRPDRRGLPPSPPKPGPPPGGQFRPTVRPPVRPKTGRSQPTAAASGYPGDFTGTPRLDYAPREDGQADPGEVVWAWVPYEEDNSQGKDRPVLVIGHDGPWLLALPMTSKDHDLDARQEAEEGRYWVDVGTGDWDRERRPSEVRVNRILRIAPGSVRRIATRLPRERYEQVAQAVRQHYR